MIENLNDYFDVNEFAENVQVGPAGSEVTILAIFDNETVDINSPVAKINTRQPKIMAKTSDISTLSKGGRVVRGGIEYYVKEIRPDGLGISEVLLGAT